MAVISTSDQANKLKNVDYLVWTDGTTGNAFIANNPTSTDRANAVQKSQLSTTTNSDVAISSSNALNISLDKNHPNNKNLVTTRIIDAMDIEWGPYSIVRNESTNSTPKYVVKPLRTTSDLLNEITQIASNAGHASSAAGFDNTIYVYHGLTNPENDTTYETSWDGTKDITFDLNTHTTVINTSIKNAYNVHTNVAVADSSIDDVENTIGRFIDNVHLDKYGRLTYEISSVTNLREHHDYNNEGLKATYHIDIDTAVGRVDSIPFVTHVAFTSGGYLTTGHSVVNHLRTHHHTNTEIENTPTTGRKSNKSELTRNVDATETSNESLKVLTYASLNTDGVLQTWHANITNIRKHHHQKRTDTASYIIYDSKNLNNYNDNFGFISEIQLDEYGKLTYQTSDVSGLRVHHTDSFPDPRTTVDNKGGSNSTNHDFVDDVSITPQGTLSGSFGRFANSHNYSTTPATRTKQGSLHTDQSTDTVIVMTYSFIDRTGQLSNRYEEIELRNQKVTIDTADHNIDEDGTQIIKSVILTKVSETDNDFHFKITKTYDNIWGTL